MRNLRLDDVESSSSLDQAKNQRRTTPVIKSSKSSGKKFNLALSPPNYKNDQMKYASLHSPRSDIGNFFDFFDFFDF